MGDGAGYRGVTRAEGRGRLNRAAGPSKLTQAQTRYGGFWFGVLSSGLRRCLVFSAFLGRGIGSGSPPFLGTKISPLWVPFPSRTDCTCSASPRLAKVHGY